MEKEFSRGMFRNRIEERQEQAIERQEARDSLSSKAQIAVLNRRLGNGMGAVKERKRLKERMED